ncbi:phage virion morphogenesis protein [Brenneria populi subsp. brevivirga]|uniref:phage virion morphogenesis protein n=1 Tax=Brenneria populi TaxID=1505588 RepID=UPI002E199F63|nr:phage virion morphogenesis protein [Brenneria populi subsp. brevivirga]
MAGVTIVFEAQQALDSLLKMEGQLADPSAMFAEMGEELLDIHQRRFAAQMSPDGVPWAPLQPWYKEQKKRNADKVLTLDGYLGNTLRWQIRAGELLFGTDLPYGAIHHFGGTIKPKTAGALNVGGRPVKQVTIPARPWLGVSDSDGKTLIDIASDHLQKALKSGTA